jgi:cobalt-precorrin-7 (C5)-methyltransferase
LGPHFPARARNVIVLGITSCLTDVSSEMVAAVLTGKRNLMILPLPWSIMPQQIAAMLLQAGLAGERPIIVYQKLTLLGESEIRTTMQELATWQDEFSDLSIVVLPHALDTSQSITEGTSNI